MTPTWLLLMRALPAHPKIARERLTVAFYLGSSRSTSEHCKMTPQEVRQELIRLIGSFVDHVPQGYAVRIFRCGAIHQPVVELIDARSAGSSNHALESKVQGRRTFIVDPEFAAPASSLTASSLTERMLQEFESDVCAGRFSFEKGHYREFSDEERKFIEDAIQS